MTRIAVAVSPSAARAVAAGAVAPVNSVAPALAGTVAVGLSPTATAGTWTGSPTVTYTLRRDGVAVGGMTNVSLATFNAYAFVAADIGPSLTVRETATNAGGSATADSTAITYSLAALATWAGAVSALDAAHVVMGVGSLVATLTDQSASAKNATQGTGANQMTLVSSDANLGSRATLSADGARRYLTAATLDVSAAYTAIAVVRPGALKSWQGFLALATGDNTGATGVDGFAVFGDASGDLWWSSPDGGTWRWKTATGTAYAANTNYVLTAKTTSAGGANRKLRRNGTDITASGTFYGAYAHPTANKAFVPGNGFAHGNARLNGTWAAALLVPSALSDANCLIVERTLGAYHGITVA